MINKFTKARKMRELQASSVWKSLGWLKHGVKKFWAQNILTILEYIWKHTVETRPKNAASMTLHPVRQVIWKYILKYNGDKPNKCNLCRYASSRTEHLRTLMQTHRRDQSNKCNLCDYATPHKGNLRALLKIHRRYIVKQLQQVCSVTASDYSINSIQPFMHII